MNNSFLFKSTLTLALTLLILSPLTSSWQQELSIPEPGKSNQSKSNAATQTGKFKIILSIKMEVHNQIFGVETFTERNCLEEKIFYLPNIVDLMFQIPPTFINVLLLRCIELFLRLGTVGGCDKRFSLVDPNTV